MEVQLNAWLIIVIYLIQIIVYVASFGMAIGVFKTRLNYMEKKLDKHNHLVERMVVVEQSCKSVHKRVDRIDKERGD